MKKNNLLLIISLLLIFTTNSCSKKDDVSNEIEQLEKKDIFSILNSKTILLDGVINTKSLKEFNDLFAKNPSVKQVQIKNCDGSINDEVNLKLAARINSLGLNTHLLKDGLIASGGVDFFLAGINRTIGENTKVGVHSWAGAGKIATDFPVGDDVHMPYINFYKSIGFSDAKAKSFYYFTINAAPAKGMHWMSVDEILGFNIINTTESFTKEKLIGTWVSDKSTDSNSMEMTIDDTNLLFGSFKKIKGQWSSLAPKGMNTFKYKLKDNYILGKLELSNGALDLYKKLNLNKEMIALADFWSNNYKEVLRVVKVNESQMLIVALSPDGSRYIRVNLFKKISE